MPAIIDLFAGPGGWDVGARDLGLDPIGIELDADACATRAAAGLRTIRGSVADLRPSPRLDGLIASPPCTAFSQAGKRKGIGHLDALCAAVRAGDWGARPSDDPTVWLVLEVGRWAQASQPRWIACEQVKQVLPIWQAYVEWLEANGWHAWAGTVSAEQYGVPQTRTRALLLAHRDRPVGPPSPTHQKYEARRPDRGRHGLLLPWVSMADALGWSGAAGFPRRNDKGDEAEYRERDLRASTLPAFGVTEKARSWTVRGTNQDNAAERAPDEPAPTIFGGNSGGNLVVNTGRDWKKGGDRADAQKRQVAEPAPTITGEHSQVGSWRFEHRRGGERIHEGIDPFDAPSMAVTSRANRWQMHKQERLPGLPEHGVSADVADRKAWASSRPATTVAGRDLVPDPGANANRYNGATKSRNDGIRVSIEDVLVLQSFPRDYPVQGTRTSRFRQVGNAIPAPPRASGAGDPRVVGQFTTDPRPRWQGGLGCESPRHDSRPGSRAGATVETERIQDARRIGSQTSRPTGPPPPLREEGRKDGRDDDGVGFLGGSRSDPRGAGRLDAPRRRRRR